MGWYIATPSRRLPVSTCHQQRDTDNRGVTNRSTPCLVDVYKRQTIYRVKVYGSTTATETMEDKILRLIQNEAANPCGSYGIMEAPQMSRQSERSAS